MALWTGKTILIAEDTAAIRTILSYLFRCQGFEVIESGDGNDALEKARTLRPDVIILDVLMPGKQGFEVCTLLKASEDTCHIPILILTSITKESGRSDEEWKRLSKADDFVSKPFKAHDLVGRIDRLMEARADMSRLGKRNEAGESID